MENIKDMFRGVVVVAFDADDTLWENEPLFREAERKWAGELARYGDLESLSDRLYEVESRNMHDLGYGAKAFGLSLLETAVEVSGGEISGDAVGRILGYVREILHNPAIPLPGVEHTLEALSACGRYRLVLLTKGDLLDQQRKLERSGLGRYFSRVVVVSNKTQREYLELCEMEGIRPEELLMVGNSFKSDIHPALQMGARTIFVPFHVVWEHEKLEEYDHTSLLKVSRIDDILKYLL